MDERDAKNIGVASHWAIRMVVVYTLIKMIYYLDTYGTGDLSFLLWDGVLLLVIGLTLFIVTRLRKTYSLPKTYVEGKTSLSKRKDARKDRIKKSYLPRALIFSVGATLAGILRSSFQSLLVSIIMFLIYFTISFLIVFVWGEFNVRSYNNSLDD